jgi:enoyl-CoA hydratase
MLKNGPLAVAAALEAAHRGMQLPLVDGQRLESSLFGLLAASEDMHEGLRAFLEKRPAQFRRR